MGKRRGTKAEVVGELEEARERIAYYREEAHYLLERIRELMAECDRARRSERDCREQLDRSEWLLAQRLEAELVKTEATLPL